MIWWITTVRPCLGLQLMTSCCGLCVWCIVIWGPPTYVPRKFDFDGTVYYIGRWYRANFSASFEKISAHVCLSCAVILLNRRYSRRWVANDGQCTPLLPIWLKVRLPFSLKCGRFWSDCPYPCWHPSSATVKLVLCSVHVCASVHARLGRMAGSRHLCTSTFTSLELHIFYVTHIHAHTNTAPPLALPSK